jgi:hypothetical protein
MATSPFQIYLVIAPIAAVFAGFGSLASGLGQREDSDDPRVDATRLTLMLFASLSATLLGLLPSTLDALLLDEQFAVRVAAIVAVLTMIGYGLSGLKRAHMLRRSPGFSKMGVLTNLTCALIALAAFGLCALGMPANRSAAFYLLGLVGLLGSSMVMFSHVIASMLRPHR